MPQEVGAVFDSESHRLFAPLILLSGGLPDLSRGSKEKRQARRRQQFEQINMSPALPEEPSAVSEARRWAKFLGIPERHQRKIVIATVAGILVVGVIGFWSHLRPPVAWTYHQLPFVARIDKMSSALNDKRTGLPAIADKLDRFQKQLIATDSFLIGKYPEFGSVILKDAELSARQGDMSNAAALLQMVAAGLSDAPIENAPSAGFFPTALETLDRVEAASSNPDLAFLAFRTRIALAVYNSRLQPLPQLPTNRPLNTSGTIVATAAAFSLRGRRVNWIGPPGGDFFRLPLTPIPGALSITLADMTLVEVASEF
jgi:hypothetical protein